MDEKSVGCHDSLECLDKQTFLQRLCGRGKGGRFPLMGQWELTYRCNLKCIMCYTDPFNTPERIRQELTTQEIVRIVDELAQAGCLFLALTGGEPTARPDFPAIYRYAKAKGLLLTIFTNGTLITPTLLDLWTELPPRMIEISLHGLTPETFDGITQGKASGAYTRVMRAIALLLERQLPLTLKTTGMKVNQEEILRIKAFVDRLGTVRYRFGSDIRPRLDGSEDPSRYQLPHGVVRTIEQTDPQLRAERVRQDRLRTEHQQTGKSRCGSWRSRFHIDAYGQLQLCSNNRRKSYDLRHGSFEEGFYRYLSEFPCPNREPTHACPTLPTQAYAEFREALIRRAAKQGRLTHAQIELTYGCNLHCVHCYTDCYNNAELIGKEWTTEEILDTLDQLHEAGVLWVCFTGGEIFMRRDFLKIYDAAKAKGFLITLFTNGTLFTEAIVDHLKASPPYKIEISCHGATPETFDRITQVPGSFQRFLEGIRLLQSRGLAFELKTKAMTLNKHELDKIKAFVESLGSRFRVSTAIYPRLDGDLTPAEYRLSPEEIVELEFSPSDQDEEETCADQEPTNLGPPSDDRLFRCGCGTTTVHLGAWGQVGSCTWVRSDENLRQTTLQEAVARYFPTLRSARYQSHSPCRSCEVFRLCRKQPAQAKLETGDPEAPVEHFCHTAFKRAKHLGLVVGMPPI